jgi:hypothetical protein
MRGVCRDEPHAGLCNDLAAVQQGVSAMKTSLFSLSSVALVAMVATTFAISPARAQVEYPWCAMSCAAGGGPMCSYTTLEQCRASLLASGYCEPNPRANASPATFKRRSR